MFLARVEDRFLVVQKNGVIASSFAKLSDIYNASYRATPHKFEVGEIVIQDDNFTIGSFKDLKHRVAAYLIMNNIESNIPIAYKNAFKMNGHNYDHDKKDGSMK